MVCGLMESVLIAIRVQLDSDLIQLALIKSFPANASRGEVIPLDEARGVFMPDDEPACLVEFRFNDREGRRFFLSQHPDVCKATRCFLSRR